MLFLTYSNFYQRLVCCLTLNPLTWKIWRASNNASRGQMGFNSAFKGLNKEELLNERRTSCSEHSNLDKELFNKFLKLKK
jgi:hypothetical protein